MDNPSTLITDLLTQSLSGYRSVTEQLFAEFSDLNDQKFAESRLATKFILSWMRDLKHYHVAFGGLFNRRKRPSIADDFTAAIGICLNEFLKSRGHEGCVSVEEQTHRQRGATRPDVSVRDASGKLIATIECKTDFGWNRNRWQLDHEKRSASLREHYPDCTTYLCVLTQQNWDNTALQNSENFGTQWFCLCKKNVGKLESTIHDSDILTPIEPMFLDTLRKLKTNTEMAG